MSQEHKNRILQWFKYVWRQVESGNFLPLLITAMVSWYVILPTYNYFNGLINNLFETDNYVISNQNALEERIKELEAKVDNQFKSRSNGSGYTSF